MPERPHPYRHRATPLSEAPAAPWWRAWWGWFIMRRRKRIETRVLIRRDAPISVLMRAIAAERLRLPSGTAIAKPELPPVRLVIDGARPKPPPTEAPGPPRKSSQ